MSQWVACKVYNVKRASLQCRLHGTTADNTHMGGQMVLIPAKEDALEEYIILMTEIGYPLTTKQLKIEVQTIMKKDGCSNPFTDDKPGCDWLRGFMKHHP